MKSYAKDERLENYVCIYWTKPLWVSFHPDNEPLIEVPQILTKYPTYFVKKPVFTQ